MRSALLLITSTAWRLQIHELGSRGDVLAKCYPDCTLPVSLALKHLRHFFSDPWSLFECCKTSRSHISYPWGEGSRKYCADLDTYYSTLAVLAQSITKDVLLTHIIPAGFSIGVRLADPLVRRPSDIE